MLIKRKRIGVELPCSFHDFSTSTMYKQDPLFGTKRHKHIFFVDRTDLFREAISSP